MKLVVKIPTRERGLSFVNRYIDNLTNLNTIIWLTLDADEWADIDHQQIAEEIGFPNSLNVLYTIGKTESKIHAYNRDIDLITERFDWDIMMVGSDDMWPEQKGFDQMIIDDMQKHFPDSDGCLWYNTEDSETELKSRFNGANIKFGTERWQRNWICMLPIVGRKYYNRFGYIYHPSYKSFWCDNEFTHVARKMKKIQPVNRTCIQHQHPSWGAGQPKDSLYIKNNSNWEADQSNFQERRIKGFAK